MFRAVWNGAMLAGSEHTIKGGGQPLLPARVAAPGVFTSSPTTSTCPWRGQAYYYHVSVNGKTNRDAAWYYPQPRPAASRIAWHVAFWRRVRVERTPGAGEEAAAGTSRGLGSRILAALHRVGAPS
jgi:uncharacterized protein (DUF427 family)